MDGTTWTLFSFGSAPLGVHCLGFRPISWNVTQRILCSLRPSPHRLALGSSLTAQFRTSVVGLLLCLMMHMAPLGPPLFSFPLDLCNRVQMLDSQAFGGPSLTSQGLGLGIRLPLSRTHRQLSRCSWAQIGDEHALQFSPFSSRFRPSRHVDIRSDCGGHQAIRALQGMREQMRPPRRPWRRAGRPLESSQWRDLCWREHFATGIRPRSEPRSAAPEG